MKYWVAEINSWIATIISEALKQHDLLMRWLLINLAKSHSNTQNNYGIFSNDHILAFQTLFWGTINNTCTAHCSQGGAKVKINVFKFWLNIHSPLPNEGLHWKRSKIEVCVALNLCFEQIHFWVLLVKSDPSSENQLF